MSAFATTIRKLIRSPKPTYEPLTPSSSWRDAFHQWAVVEVASDMPSTPPTLQFVHWPANQDAPASVASPTPTCAEDFTILTSVFSNESSEDWSSIRSVSVYSEDIEFSSVASSTAKQVTVDFPAICDDASSVDNESTTSALMSSNTIGLFALVAADSTPVRRGAIRHKPNMI